MTRRILTVATIACAMAAAPVLALLQYLAGVSWDGPEEVDP